MRIVHASVRAVPNHDEEDATFELAGLRTLDRRKLILGAGGSAAALAFMVNHPTRASARVSAVPADEDPFTLGVASGDPLPNGVVLWTRLAPRPFEAYGGLSPDRAVEVKWQVSTDENFSTVVRQGTELAHPEYSFSVHVDATGLEPDTVYHYRFATGGHLSPTGRTRTAPAPGADLSELKFAFASCNSFGAGWFTSADHLADEDVDLIFFLGDYIYEYPLVAEQSLRENAPEMPSVLSTSTGSLSRYRLQYAAYRLEPELQRAHQNAPWIVTWDDHEVENDVWGFPDDADHVDEMVQRANAYRAYWEHMPLRRRQMPKGPDARLYRRFDFGQLARFSMLDVRQFRTEPLSGSSIVDSPERRDPTRSMLGRQQEAWFLDGLRSSPTQWNVAAQGVLMSLLDTDPGEERAFSNGGWDAYQASQQRVMDTVTQHEVDNFVVLTGDIHRNYALSMLADFDDLESPRVGSEFAVTSMTSGGDGTDSNAGLEDRLRSNPHLAWGSLQRGYARGRFTPDRLEIDYREVRYVQRKGAPVDTSRSFVVEAGRPGLEDA